MMPVWAWVLIWTLLAAGLVAMLVWFALRLFRKLMGTLGALEDLGDQLAELDLDSDLSKTAFRPAVFQSRRELAATIEQAGVLRAYSRAHRRDLRINRGKLIQHTPYKPEDRPPC